MLVKLLPLYDEIKEGNYQFLKLVSSINEELVDEESTAKTVSSKFKILSPAQKTFLKCISA